MSLIPIEITYAIVIQQWFLKKLLVFLLGVSFIDSSAPVPFIVTLLMRLYLMGLTNEKECCKNCGLSTTFFCLEISLFLHCFQRSHPACSSKIYHREISFNLPLENKRRAVPLWHILLHHYTVDLFCLLGYKRSRFAGPTRTFRFSRHLL